MKELPTKVEDYKRSLDEKLSTALENAVDIVNKNYLQVLDELDIVQPSEEELDIDIAQCGKFYQLKRLVLNKEENFIDKLITIVNVVSSVDGTLSTIIKSDGNKIEYYIGIISKNYRLDHKKDRTIRAASARAFSGALEGNFTGSELYDLDEKEIEKIQKSIFDNKVQSISAISGIVSLRSKEEKDITKYVQGIENLTNSLKGKKYCILMIADPVSTGQIQSMKQGYEMIHTQLSTFLKNVLTVNESDNITMSNSQTEGITRGITEGISKTQSKGTMKSKSIGMNMGVHITPMGIGGSFGISTGFSNGTTVGEAYSKNSSTTDQTMKQVGYSKATAIGTGKSLQITCENRIVKDLLEKIDTHINRLNLCESFGGFQCAAYILSESQEDTLTVASNYNALMRGEDSFIQASQINTWNKEIGSDKRKFDTLIKYLNSFVHPSFYFDSQKKITVTPVSLISGKELAIQFGLPKKSVNGLTVMEMTPFGRDIIENQETNIEVGNLYYMGKKENQRIALDLNSFSSHVFITGSTGSGKSNTVYKLLSELEEKNTKFMIIEPAKGEYKHIFGNQSNVNVFGTNEKIAQLLKINPFQFPEEIHVLEHIDRLVEIFNVCWPMYAAMPAVLKDAVEKAYINCGWNLVTSENEYGKLFYPTFADVFITLQDVVEESAYSEEVKSNYKGSLLTRIKSLTNGINGQIFCGKEIENHILFDENVIIDLSRVGSVETKALIMGILVMRLSEHRMTQGGMNLPLRHVTVLEEAHNLLKRTSTEQGLEGSNVLGKSVEMLSNSIAEMRTYGEGFVIIDQSPGLLDLSVIRNTNTKIVLRLPEASDRELVGRASGMTEEQIVELSKLEKGVAAIYQNNWLEPVLCKVDCYETKQKVFLYQPFNLTKEEKKIKTEFIKLLLQARVADRMNVNIEQLEKEIESISISTKSRIDILSIMEEYRKYGKLSIWDNENFGLLSKIVVDLLECKHFISQIFRTIQSIEDLNEKMKSYISLKVEKISSKMMNEVCHCIMKEMSSENEENLKLYHLWKKHMYKIDVR